MCVCVHICTHTHVNIYTYKLYGVCSVLYISDFSPDSHEVIKKMRFNDIIIYYNDSKSSSQRLYY